MTAAIRNVSEIATMARASRLRTLHPGWFAPVMGTGILAVAAYRNPGNVDALRSPAHAAGATLGVVAALLACVLAGPYLARWVRHPDAATADLRHPVLGPLYGTFPGGLLVLSVTVSTVGGVILPEAAVVALTSVLTLVGGLLAFVAAVAFGYVVFTGEIETSEVNGGWFIPPVVTIIVPVALVPLLPHVSPEVGRLLLALSWALFGMGLLLFLFVMALLMQRLVVHPLPAAPLAPSLAIGLGPLGVGAAALTTLASAQPANTAPAIQALTQVAATSLWGFGLWWLAVVTALLVRYLGRGPLPYGLGWWGFTFPLGAYTVATMGLARLWQSDIIEAFAAALFLALLGAWLVVTSRTIGALRTAQV